MVIRLKGLSPQVDSDRSVYIQCTYSVHTVYMQCTCTVYMQCTCLVAMCVICLSYAKIMIALFKLFWTGTLCAEVLPQECSFPTVKHSNCSGIFRCN